MPPNIQIRQTRVNPKMESALEHFINPNWQPPKGSPELKVSPDGTRSVVGGTTNQKIQATIDPYINLGIGTAVKVANPVPNANQKLQNSLEKAANSDRAKAVNNSRDPSIPIKPLKLYELRNYGDPTIKGGDPVVKIITLGDARTDNPAKKDGKLLMVVPDRYYKESTVSIPGVTARSDPKAILAAVRHLLADTSKYPYVYTHTPNNTKQPYSITGNNAGKELATQPKLNMQEQRDALLSELNHLPPVVREAAGFMVSLYFETFGKLGIGADKLSALLDGVASKITESPQAWQNFIDQQFPANRPEFAETRAYLQPFPKKGAKDNKTKLAILLAADAKFVDKTNKTAEWVWKNPLEAAANLCKGLALVAGTIIVDAYKFVLPENSNNFSDNLGAYLAHGLIKGATTILPVAKTYAWTGKLVKTGAVTLANGLGKNLAKMSPQLVANMGKQKFDDAIQGLHKASQRAQELAMLAKKPGGLSPVQQTEQQQLVQQINKAIQAIDTNNEVAFKEASEGLGKIRNQIVPFKRKTTHLQLLQQIESKSFEQKLASIKDWLKTANKNDIDALAQLLKTSNLGKQIWQHESIVGSTNGVAIQRMKALNIKNAQSQVTGEYTNSTPYPDIQMNANRSAGKSGKVDSDSKPRDYWLDKRAPKPESVIFDPNSGKWEARWPNDIVPRVSFTKPDKNGVVYVDYLYRKPNIAGVEALPPGTAGQILADSLKSAGIHSPKKIVIVDIVNTQTSKALESKHHESTTVLGQALSNAVRELGGTTTRWKTGGIPYHPDKLPYIEVEISYPKPAVNPIKSQPLLPLGKDAPPPLTPQQVEKINKWKEFNSSTWLTQSQVSDNIYKSYREAVTNTPGNSGRVLEIGPGRGEVVHGLLNREPNVKVVAIDIDPDNLNTLRNSIPKNQRSRFETQAGDVTEIDFGKNNSNLIIAEKLFPHLNDAEVALVLKKSHAALQPGGIVICDFFTTEHIQSKMNRVAVFRSVAEAKKLVQKDFDIISEKNVGPMVTYTLRKR
jgi:ubiquinone/menaquinone biosynthesis C-methylase UbiE